MKTLLFLSMLLCNVIVCHGQHVADSLETKARNNQLPEKWNMEPFHNDKRWQKSKNSEPMNSLAFPVEEYEYYVFTKPFTFKMGQSHFSGISFGENIGGKDGEFIFKHELTLIFYTAGEAHEIEGDASSRNYPYLTVQGHLDLNNRYDFIGIKSPEDAGYLIVNLKSFDLRFGQTVILFPGDDFFYYLQSNEEPKTGEDFNEYLTRVQNDSRIKEMIALVKRSE